MTYYDWDASGEPVECSHEFEVDLNCLVKVNYDITKEGIERAETEAISRAQQESAGETDIETIEAVDSWISHEKLFYDGLQGAARNLALVALVTRLHHWVSLYARRLEPNRSIKSLSAELGFLNSSLKGHPPEPISFFEELANVRDSVIHADSKSEWSYSGQLRQVADKYVRANHRVEISDEDLIKAIAVAVRQVKWYDEKLKAIDK